MSSATFKLAPIPLATSTLLLNFQTGAALGGAAAAVSASQLDPMCLDVEVRTGRPAVYQLLLRFGGTATANNEQASSASSIAAEFSPISNDVLDRDDGLFWRDRADLCRLDYGTNIRASWLPAALPALLTLLTQIAADTGVTFDCQARAAVGAGDMHIGGEAAARMAAVARLRERSDVVGHVVVVQAGADAQHPADAWGSPLPSAVIAGAIKRALDPAGVLNAGRGPI